MGGTIANYHPFALALTISAGILMAYLTILMGSLGLNIYRNNHGWRGWFGAAMVLIAVAMWFVIFLSMSEPPSYAVSGA